MSAEETRAPSTVGAVFRALNGVGAPGGPILHMLRTLTVTTTSATLVGAASGWIGQELYGIGAIGFAIGSSVGFLAASIGYFLHCWNHSIAALERFPTLMKIHLISNFRLSGFERLQLEDREVLEKFKDDVRRSWRLRCWLITAWQSASSSIEEVDRLREAELVAELGSKSR